MSFSNLLLCLFSSYLSHTMIFTGWQKGHGMKLIGSYTSPFVRKISVLLLEKGITFEFINELPYEADNGVAQYNPLGKVPALVTEKGSTGSIRRSSRNILNCWISRQRCSRVTRWQRLKFASLKRWLTALWMQRWCLYANRRARRRNNRKRNCCASGKNQPQPGYARKLSERRDAKNGYGQSGDYRDCLCGRLSQLPPGRAWLVC